MLIRLLLADDSAILREAIVRLLDGDPEIQLVAEAVSLKQAMQLASKFHPDVIVMDLHMCRDSDVMPSQIKSHFAGSRLLVISFSNDKEAKALADSFGAVTFLDKLRLVAELLPAIKQGDNKYESVEPTPHLSSMETDTFDIFSGLSDRDAMWVEAVTGIDQARERIQQIAAVAMGEYFIFHSRTGAILSRVSTTQLTAGQKGCVSPKAKGVA